jgi:CRP/FNR family transcriptional regulator, transcriptional activator FtrB
MRERDAEQIRALPLFQGMDEGHFEILMRAAYLQRFPAHVTLIREGDPADFLHIVIDGAVDLFSAHAGRETSLWIAQPVSTFILAAVVRDEVYLNSVRTLEPSQILMIPSEAVRAIFDKDEAFARSIVRELAARYRSVVKDLKNLKLRPSLERLANWLLVTHAACGGADSFAIPFDKKTLAARLGMTPENLSRNFATLAEHGVEIDGRDIRLADMPALTKLAKPAALIDNPDA